MVYRVSFTVAGKLCDHCQNLIFPDPLRNKLIVTAAYISILLFPQDPVQHINAIVPPVEDQFPFALHLIRRC